MGWGFAEQAGKPASLPTEHIFHGGASTGRPSSDTPAVLLDYTAIAF